MKKQKIMLMPGVWLASLDKRSGRTFDHFTHRIDIYKLEPGITFINWCRDTLGEFVPWNLYYTGRDHPGFVVPNWTIRYQEPGSVFTEIFIKPELMPMVILKWT